MALESGRQDPGSHFLAANRPRSRPDSSQVEGRADSHLPLKTTRDGPVKDRLHGSGATMYGLRRGLSLP